MSETFDEDPRRGRPPRIEAEQGERRRRRPDSLNRMVASNLGLPDECLDLETYHYHWVNDEMGKVAMMTTNDDYDPVTMEELEENARRNRMEFKVNRDRFSTGFLGGISLPVMRDGTRAVLLRKRKTFYEADYEEQVMRRQAMMEAVVYEGDFAAIDQDGKGLKNEIGYVPKGNTLGDTAPRRRGPIPRRSL